MAKTLNAKQQRFCEEYIIDLNATQAAIRAKYSERTANEQGARLLTNVSVQEYIQVLQNKRSARTEITADLVLKRFWDIATADPNELIQLRRTCCRYCFGKDHEYQWTEREYRDTEAVAISNGKKPPVNAGGFGFNPTLDPNAACPECHGQGRENVYMGDTRKLTGAAKVLYAGVKETREGIEIKMQDQQKALINVARHLGMFNEKPAPPPAPDSVIPDQEYTLSPDEDVPDAPIL